MFSQMMSDGSSASSMRHTLPPITAFWFTSFFLNRASCSSHKPEARRERCHETDAVFE